MLSTIVWALKSPGTKNSNLFPPRTITGGGKRKISYIPPPIRNTANPIMRKRKAYDSFSG